MLDSTRFLISLGLASVLVFPTPVQAQSYQCRPPSGLSAPAERKPASAPRRIQPVTAYTLALSWSPEFCRTRKDSPRDRTQCSGDDGSFAFILHGLWPETRGPGYPQYCAPTKPLPAGQMRNAFAAANDGVMPDMVRLKVNERGWLQEVKLCLGQSFRPQRCPAYMRAVKENVPVKIWRGG